MVLALVEIHWQGIALREQDWIVVHLLAQDGFVELQKSAFAKHVKG